VSEGQLGSREPTSAAQACMLACELKSSCAELSAVYCDERIPDSVRACERACAAPAACRDGRGTYSAAQACDGRAQCADGSDELGCDAARFCTSNGVRIQPYQLCNGVAECPDASDEDGCASQGSLFACKTRTRGFAQYIPLERVCDLVTDCVDGSDEGRDQGCAVLACP